jgi:ligand-binding sensor domain-containing protein
MCSFYLRLIALFLICSLPIKGISQQYNFRNFSVKDGVAQSQVYAIHQDFRGYLWLGTRGGGISRFDGTNFKTFTEKDGLVNNYIYTIQEDSKHTIWIGTNNGLSAYNGNRFENFLPPNTQSQWMILDLAFDKNGDKWLATNQGVKCLKGKNFIDISTKLGLKAEMINTILVDSRGTIWFGTGEGLFSITTKNGQFKLTDYSAKSRYMRNAITKIREDKSGNLWIGTYGDGMYCYAKNQFFRIDLQLELYRQTVLDIFFDKNKNLWIGTLNQGVAQYNTQSKNFTWLSENEGLSNNHVRSIIQDRSGNFWFGTSGGGVCNYFGKQFTNYDKANGLGGNFIYSIFRDSKNNLWVGTSQKGLSKMTENGFRNFDASNGFQDVKVKAIQEDLNGNLYFGTDGQGVYRFDGAQFSIVPGLEKKYIRSIVKDLNGDLWIATAGTGIHKLSFSDGRETIQTFTVANGLLANRLTVLHLDKKGRIWYGTESHGVGIIENDVPQKRFFRQQEGLPSNAIRSFAEDKNGTLWIGTAGSGIASLNLYTPKNQANIQKYNYENGLNSSNIYLLTIDSKNNLIAGSESGLDYITLNKQRGISSVKHYSKGDGFTGVETCQNAVFNDKDGTIWFGTINGLSKYNPSNAVKNNQEPITNILDVKLFYKSISSGPYKYLVGNWNQVNDLVLPYDQNHLSFDFFAINFSNPESVKYKWKLAGFDENWSPASTEHNIVYSNISPGKYIFLVKACNEDGIWNKVPQKIRFEIKAPFWLQWWFITLEIIVFIALIIGVFRFQVNRIRKKSREMQKQLQMAKEIVELEQKTLRLQMNPHFIFNALNSIQSNIGTGNEKEARYYLAKFSRLMRQILDNSRNAVITLEEEVQTLENYLLIEKFCNGDRFDYQINVDLNLEADFIQIPPMLLQPFVENAIKHGFKQKDASNENNQRGLIIVDFKEKGNILECSVTDNGIGREKANELNQLSKETYHKSTALLVTQERLDLLNENENFQSLEMIDLYDENGVATGTKVMLRLKIG